MAAEANTTLTRISKKISGKYESASDDVTYSTFKETSGLGEENDADIKNALKQVFHSYVVTNKVYGLRQRKNQNFLSALEKIVKFLKLFQEIVLLIAKSLLPIAVSIVLLMVYKSWIKIDSIFQTASIVSILLALIGPYIFIYLWRMLP